MYEDARLKMRPCIRLCRIDSELSKSQSETCFQQAGSTPSQDETRSSIPTESDGESINHIQGEIQVKSGIAPTNNGISSSLSTEVFGATLKPETQQPTAASFGEHSNGVSASDYTTEKVTDGNESINLGQVVRLSRNKRPIRFLVDLSESLSKENRKHSFAVDHTTANRNQTIQTPKQKATCKKQKSGKLKDQNMKALCTLCNKTFSNSGGVHRHRQHVHLRIYNYKYNCEDCEQRFMARYKYVEHRRRYHTFEKPYQCDICKKRFFRRESARNHMLNHTGIKPVPCKRCGQLFALEGNLKTHLRECKRNARKMSKSSDPLVGVDRTKSVTCPDLENSLTTDKTKCGNERVVEKNFQNCTSSKLLSLDQSTMSRGSSYEQQMSSLTQRGASLSEGHRGVLFVGDHSAENGNQIVQFLQNKVTGKEHTNASNEYGDIKPTCPICNKTFSNSGSMHKHKKHVHLRIYNYKYNCEVCGERFMARCKYLEHCRRIHTFEKPFQCDICSKRFFGQPSVRFHIMRHHTGMKPVACKQCGQLFAREDNMNSHQKDCKNKRISSEISHKIAALSNSNRVKNGEWNAEDKSKECEPSESVHSATQCVEVNVTKKLKSGNEPFTIKKGKAASEKDAAAREVNLHCKICNILFESRALLIQHKYVHNSKQFQCDVCSMLLTSVAGLRKHKKHVHDRDYDRKYVCDVCGKRFYVRKSCLHHIRQCHTGETPYLCHLCEKSFASAHALRAHQIRHNGQKPHKCTLCGKAFPYLSSLKVHHLSHSGEAPYSCTICGRLFPTEAALKCHRKSVKIPQSCNNCSKLFCTNSSLQLHLKICQPVSPKLVQVNRSLKSSKVRMLLMKKENVHNKIEERFHEKGADIMCEQNNVEVENDGSQLKNLKIKNQKIQAVREHGQVQVKMNTDQDQVNELLLSDGQTQDSQSVSDQRSTKPLKCENCGKIFSSLRTFNRHQHSTTCSELLALMGNEAPSVDQQFLLFLQQNKYGKEKQSSRTSRGPQPEGEMQIICDLCGKIYASKSSLHHHRKEVHLKIFNLKHVCKFCGKRFYKISHYQSHVNSHTGERPYECDICKRKFSSKGNLRTHMLVHQNSERVACTLCNKSFSDKHGYKYHVQQIHLGGGRPYTCDICQKTTRNKTNLRTHMRSHTQEKKEFQCERCSKWFVSSKSRENHMNKACPVGGSYICRDCMKPCASKRILLWHIEQIHKEPMLNRQFACTICNKHFTKKFVLADHILTHGNEKQCQCSHCPKAFFHTRALKIHMISHQKQKHFTCSDCSTEFKYRNSFYLHRRKYCHVSGTYLCRDCPSKFATKEALTSHFEREHISNGTPKKKVPRPTEKLYKCDVCFKSFAYKQVLETHMNSHAGKQFKCKNCSKPFTYKNSLWLHIKKHCRSKKL